MEKTGRPKYDVFISHSSINKNVADAICADFEQHKIKCWYAPRDIRAGESWPSAIKHGIEEAEILILVFSENANESRQVINEVSLAYNQGKTIIPFKIANTPMNDDFDYFLNRVHWLDAVTQPLEESITSLRKYVENILGYTSALEEQPESENAKEAADQAAKEAAKEAAERAAKEAAERLEEEQNRLNRKVEEERQRLEAEAALKLEAEKKHLEEEAARRLEEERKRIEAEAQQKLADERKKAGMETAAPEKAETETIVVSQKPENRDPENDKKKWILPAGIGAALLIVIIVAVIASQNNGGGQKKAADTSAAFESETATELAAASSAAETKTQEVSEPQTKEAAEVKDETGSEEDKGSEKETESVEPKETKLESLERGEFDYLCVNNLNQGGYAAYSPEGNTIFYYWPGKGLLWRDAEGAITIREDELEFCNMRADISDSGSVNVQFHSNDREKGISSYNGSSFSPTRLSDGTVLMTTYYYAPISIYVKGTLLLRSYKNDFGEFRVYRDDMQKHWLLWESASDKEIYQIDEVYHGRIAISGNYIFWASDNHTISYISLDQFGLGTPETIETEDSYISDMTSDEKGNIYVICDATSGYGSNIFKISPSGILDTYQVPKGNSITYYDGNIYFMNTVKETAGYVNKVYKYDFSEAKKLYETTSDVDYEKICVVPVPGKKFGFILIYGYNKEDSIVAAKGLTNGGSIKNGGMEFSNAE